jgi:protein required for attachment to host cells
MSTYLVVADSSKARIMQLTPGLFPALEPVETLECPSARLAKHEMQSDRGATVFARAGHAGPGSPQSARSSTGSDHDPHVVEMDRFAKSIAGKLDLARQQGHAHRFLLVAGPRFLGVLRKHLSDPTRHLVTGELDRDLIHSPDDQIVETLRREGFLAPAA